MSNAAKPSISCSITFRSDYKRTHGSAYTLQHFHDTLPAHADAPVPPVRPLMVKHLSLMLCIVLATAAPLIAEGNVPHRIAELKNVPFSNEQSGIAFAILPLQSKYELGHPILFTLAFRNESTRELDAFRLGSGTSFDVFGPNGSVKMRRAPLCLGIVRCLATLNAGLSIVPGESEAGLVDLVERVAIDEPGNYRVRCKITTERKRFLTSPWISINVVNPVTVH